MEKPHKATQFFFGQQKVEAVTRNLVFGRYFSLSPFSSQEQKLLRDI